MQMTEENQWTLQLQQWNEKLVQGELTFQDIKSGMSGIDTDNAFNGVGITMGWDSRFNRLFLNQERLYPIRQPA
jgi:hypothetical protein